MSMAGAAGMQADDMGAASVFNMEKKLILSREGKAGCEYYGMD